MPSLSRVRESIRTSLWFVPSLFALGAVALWAAMRGVDSTDVVEKLPLGFDAGPAGARDVLSAIATSMIAFTGVVFSVTMVVLQLASSQYTPRVLRTFLRDRTTQVALGSFIATFVYALLVLRGVQSEGADREAFVPRLSITVAFVLLGVSLVMFVAYINQIAQSIRGSRIVARAGDETRAVLGHLTSTAEDRAGADLLAPAEPAAASTAPVALAADSPGYVLGFDTSRIVDVAGGADTCLVAVVRPGDFVATEQPLLVGAPGTNVDQLDLRGMVEVGGDRAMDQDVRFGFRQLVDIALRALSPSLNDPTTAVQCLDQIHDLLRRVVRAPFRSGEHHDRGGRLRFVEPPVQWADLVDLGMTEIVLACGGQVQVRRRLIQILDDLHTLAPPERRPPIVEQQTRVPLAPGR